MNFVFPVTELLDRYAIAMVKFSKTRGANLVELDFYREQIQDYDLSIVESELKELQSIHNDIWELEKELKSGHEENLALEDIGRRAIKIRDKNNSRIKLKNYIAEKLGCSVREIKKDHLSE